MEVRQQQQQQPLSSLDRHDDDLEYVSTDTTTSTDHRREVVRSITQRVLAIAVDEMKRPDTKLKIQDHVIAPLIKMIYSQMYPYLIIAASVLLSGLVMWVLMFTMFTMSYFRKS